MPLRVTVEIVPGGHEPSARVINTIAITQIAKLDDDEGGLRRYLAVDKHGDEVAVEHYRARGHEKLVSLVTDALYRQLHEAPERPSCTSADVHRLGLIIDSLNEAGTYHLNPDHRSMLERIQRELVAIRAVRRP